MKITTPPKTVQPITITLETQEEIDQLYAIVHNRIIVPSSESPLFALHSTLSPHQVNGNLEHNALTQRLKNYYTPQFLSGSVPIEELTD